MDSKVTASIDSEIEYQNNKWGYGPDHQHSVAEWLMILDRLVQDGKAAWWVSCKNPETLAFFRKIAATAVQAMLLHGCENREVPKETNEG